VYDVNIWTNNLWSSRNLRELPLDGDTRRERRPGGLSAERSRCGEIVCLSDTETQCYNVDRQEFQNTGSPFGTRRWLLPV